MHGCMDVLSSYYSCRMLQGMLSGKRGLWDAFGEEKVPSPSGAAVGRLCLWHSRWSLFFHRWHDTGVVLRVDRRVSPGQQKRMHLWTCGSKHAQNMADIGGQRTVLCSNQFDTNIYPSDPSCWFFSIGLSRFHPTQRCTPLIPATFHARCTPARGHTAWTTRHLHQGDPGINRLVAVLRQEAAQIRDNSRGDQHITGEVVVPRRAAMLSPS